MTATELAQLIVASHDHRKGRSPPLVPLLGKSDRQRVSTFDLRGRLKRKKREVDEDRLRQAMSALAMRGAVSYGPGGWAVVDMEALRTAAA